MKSKIVSGDYIIAIGNSGGNEITEEEYNTILAIIRTPRPEPPEGKAWALLDITYEYVLIDEPEPDQIEGE